MDWTAREEDTNQAPLPDYGRMLATQRLLLNADFLAAPSENRDGLIRIHADGLVRVMDGIATAAIRQGVDFDPELRRDFEGLRRSLDDISVSPPKINDDKIQEIASGIESLAHNIEYSLLPALQPASPRGISKVRE